MPLLGTQLQLRYLYGSRQAWYLPSLAGGVDVGVPWVLEGVPALSPRQFLQRLGLEPEAFRPPPPPRVPTVDLGPAVRRRRAV